MKILICDDDSMTLRTLEFQFKKEGFEVIKCFNGREASRILEESYDIDLLVTDLYMPMMTGLELITFVRTTLQRTTPSVIVSRVNVDDSINQALELGANAYIAKPFLMEDLSNKIKNVINNI